MLQAGIHSPRLQTNRRQARLPTPISSLLSSFSDDRALILLLLLVLYKEKADLPLLLSLLYLLL